MSSSRLNDVINPALTVVSSTATFAAAGCACVILYMHLTDSRF